MTTFPISYFVRVIANITVVLSVQRALHFTSHDKLFQIFFYISHININKVYKRVCTARHSDFIYCSAVRRVLRKAIYYTYTYSKKNNIPTRNFFYSSKLKNKF